MFKVSKDYEIKIKFYIHCNCIILKDVYNYYSYYNLLIIHKFTILFISIQIVRKKQNADKTQLIENYHTSNFRRHIFKNFLELF